MAVSSQHKAAAVEKGWSKRGCTSMLTNQLSCHASTQLLVLQVLFTATLEL
jgi:hypothetical protein